MKLYYSPGACSLSPHIVLQASGLAFTLELASTKTHQLKDGTDYYSINPLGYVPLLELNDGTLLSEGPAIVQYIADQAPEKQLAPANGTLARYQLQSWLNFIGTELHKGFAPLFNPATPADFKPVVIERLLSRMSWVDSQLAGKEYLMGEHFTVADAYLFTVTGWGGYVKVDLSGFAHIAAYRARLSNHPAVQAALRAEGLLK
jgi:glutathione S-transferase